MTLLVDNNLRKTLIRVYDGISVDGGEVFVTSPEYKQVEVDALVNKGLISKKDASSLEGWAYIVRPTYKGEQMCISARNPLRDRVEYFIRQGEEIGRSEIYASGNTTYGTTGRPMYDKWMGEINIFNERHLKEHPLHNSIYTTYFHRKSDTSYDDMMGHLRALAADEEFFGVSEDLNEESVMNNPNVDGESYGGVLTENIIDGNERLSNKVFIVHGHDNEAKQEMARTLEKAGFEAIILHEQPDGGCTIIEKIERYSNVSFAVVLYTECDRGRAKEDSIESEKLRARQNVVFEHGYLIGKLGRDHVCALVKGNVETPGDISGVVYVPMDPNGAWKIQLGKNMKDVGIDVDFNKLCG